MYTRNFYPEKTQEISIPENYDGTALARSETVSEENTYDTEQEALKNEQSTAEPDYESVGNIFESKKGDENRFLSGIFSRLPIKNLAGFFKGNGSGCFKLGTEELIIIGIALFLLFSKGGDKECAVMLLLLLFF